MYNPIRATAMMNLRRAAWVKPALVAGLVAICFFAFCLEADAAPGGQFVKQALSSKYGRIGALIVGCLLLLLVILLLPLFLYAMYAESSGIRKTKADLAVLAAKYRWFDWLGIRDRVNKAVRDIASVWATGNLSSVAPLMTPDYFASQQALLERWVDEGKQIVYRLEKVRRIEPLAVSVESAEAYSWIRVLVSVDCVDYMRDRHTMEVVKGDVDVSRGFESVWCFVYQDRQWLLNGIEEGSTSLTWATTKNSVDTSYIDSGRDPQRQQVREQDEIPARATRGSQSASLDATPDQPAATPKQRFVGKPANDDE
ncbi:MAG: hypothetical protein JSS49_26650 [Planctomycetes bacterium]|nr:hypothetical protein [Planctomycetota bacterium]